MIDRDIFNTQSWRPEVGFVDTIENLFFIDEIKLNNVRLQHEHPYICVLYTSNIKIEQCIQKRMLCRE